MTDFKKILQTAVLGTSQSPLEPENIYKGISIESANTPEEKILMIAAYESLIRKSGYAPLPFEGEKEQTVCPPETQLYLSQTAAEFVQTLFYSIKSGDLFVIKELLESLVKKNQILTPDLIIPLMDFVQKNPSLLRLAEKTTGERGKWIGSFNPVWRFQSSEASPSWENGTRSARIEWFKQTLYTNPAEAIHNLEETWKYETLSQKKDFMNILVENPVPEALKFLDALILDTDIKDRELRNLCIHTAIRIPQSQILERLTEYAKKLIFFKSSLISGGKIVLEPLTTLTDEMKRDGIGIQSDTAFHHTISLHCQLISLLPSTFWIDSLKLNPQDWAKVMKKQAHFTSIWKALALAGILHKDPIQLEIVLEYNLAEQVELKEIEKGISLFPQKEFGEFVLKFAPRYKGKPTITLLSLRKTAWSIPESESACTELNAALQKYALKAPWDASELTALIQTSSQHAHPTYLKKLTEIIYKIGHFSTHWQKDTEKHLQRLENRRKIMELIEGNLY